jgi:hypothetical protein
LSGDDTRGRKLYPAKRRAQERLESMKRAFASVLLAAGISALAYCAFTPSERSPHAKVGALDITVALGFVGGGLLVARRK